jgi:hypothetical protein
VPSWGRRSSPDSSGERSRTRHIENGTRLSIGDGLWTNHAKLVTRRDAFADPTAGQVAVWGVLDETAHRFFSRCG